MKNNPKVVVVQRGARRRYAVASLLERRGYLTQLVTDAHRDSTVGKLARRLSAVDRVPRVFQRLGARDPVGVGIPLEKIAAQDCWMWHEFRLRKLRQQNISDWLIARDERWATMVLKRVSWDSCNVLYSMAGENVRILSEARARGIKVVIDAFISPFNLRETLEVKQRLGIGPTRDEAEHVSTENHYLKVYGLADRILCPSQWVADAMVALNPAFAAKVVICPYGSSLRTDPGRRAPVPGRVFWAGGDWLRKGLDQLAAAADLLKLTHPEYEFRAAGITDPEVLAMPRFRNIHFLGKLSREEMEAEFLSADLFAFPTLSEGMAAVAVEAISAGCPVITTRAAGIDAIEHGKSGILLETHHPEELANHIAALCGDRAMLAAMSCETVKLADYYNEEAWSARLCELIEDVLA